MNSVVKLFVPLNVRLWNTSQTVHDATPAVTGQEGCVNFQEWDLRDQASTASYDGNKFDAGASYGLA